MMNENPKAAPPGLRNETEMRAFLQAAGIRPETIERAVKAGQNESRVLEKKPHPMKGKKRKAAQATG